MIELIILGMLYDERELTSYALKKMMEQSTDFFHNSSLGSIQPALKKLEQRGLLTSKESIESNRLKKYYLITKEGKAYFKLKIRENLGSDKLKCSQLVKVFFFDKFTPEEQQASLDEYINDLQQTIMLLKSIETHSEAHMQALERTFDSHPSAQYKMDTLQFGLDYFNFVSNWFTDYKRELNRRHFKK